MSDVFDDLLGQPRVRDYLRRSVHDGRVSHAYLFIGPAGAGKTQAAYAFAAALLCEADGCNTCETCRKVLRHKHPDVRLIEPLGAHGYLIEQVRDIVNDMALAPIQASKKIYIFNRADMLGTQAANAFLKSLEEPPADVVIILLGRTREAVLPTIVSRCQVVPFRALPPQEACGIMCQEAGITEARARVALEACNGSLARALEFCKSNERMAFRVRVLEGMARLSVADDWDILEFSSTCVADAKVPLQALKAAQEEQLAACDDFMSRSAIKQMETRHTRAMSAKTFEALHQVTAIMRSWVRDVMVCSAGAPELIINNDVRTTIEEVARRTDEARCCRALGELARFDAMFEYNVSPQACMDAMLLSVRDTLFGLSDAQAL